jgi:hypothetical protein
VAQVAKLQVAHNWFVTKKDAHMAFYLRRLIALAKRFRVQLFCLCRPKSGDNNCLWIACDLCGSWYHSACVGVAGTQQELETKNWTCPIDCTHVPTVPEEVQTPTEEAAAAVTISADAVPEEATAPTVTVPCEDQRRMRRAVCYRAPLSDSDTDLEQEEEEEDEEPDGSDGHFSDSVASDDEDGSESEDEADFAEALDSMEQKWVPALFAQQELALESKPTSQKRAAVAQLKQQMEQQNEQEEDSDWSEGAEDCEQDSSGTESDVVHDVSSDQACASDFSDEDDASAWEPLGKRKRHATVDTEAIRSAAKRSCLDDLRTLPAMPPAGTAAPASDATFGTSCVTAKCQSNHPEAIQLTAPLHASMVNEFVAEMCAVQRGLATPAGQLYRHYHTWHRHSPDQSRHKCMGKKVFWRAMDARWCKSKTDGSIMYRGIALD